MVPHRQPKHATTRVLGEEGKRFATLPYATLLCSPVPGGITDTCYTISMAILRSGMQGRVTILILEADPTGVHLLTEEGDCIGDALLAGRKKGHVHTRDT